MKKTFFSFLATALSIFVLSETAFAAPAVMSDGSVFDAEFYAISNPDVVAVLGTDSTALYNHYLTNGAKEGRLPYAPGTDVNAIILKDQQLQAVANTTGGTQALKKAKSYLSWTNFSQEGLYEQLLFEGFTEIEAEYAVTNCGANWYTQALSDAKSYLSWTSFSQSGLYNQLLFEGYTELEAEYAITNCGANWYDQAVKKAKSYMSWSAFSRDRLIAQLLFEGFTEDQALYGVAGVGY